MKKQWFAVYILMVVCFAACQSNKKPTLDNADKEFIVLFTNDIHSQILPLEDNNMGGALRRKVVIDSIRATHDNVLLVDAGDVVQGTVFFNIFKGEVEMMIMNELGYDIRTLGNHEFDNRMDGLKQMLLWNNHTTTIATNYSFSDSVTASLIQKSAIVPVGDIKVGFVSANTNPNGIIDPTYRQGLSYTDPLELTDHEAQKLKQQGADIVIALSHLGLTDEDNRGYTVDTTLVKASQHIDLIIGGHSHTFLHTPFYTPNLNGDSIAILQAGKYGQYLGSAKITLSANSSPTIEYSLIPLSPNLDSKIDSAFANKIDRYTQAVNKTMNKHIGTTLHPMAIGKPESPLGNWVCDALIIFAKQYMNTEADFAIYNTHGIRYPLPQGNITLGHIYQSFPFDNNLSIIKLKGSEVISLFQTIALRGGEAVSNEVRLTIADDKATNITINSKAIDPTKTYTIAMPDYVANGGDQMEACLNASSRTDYPLTIRDMIIQHIEQLATQGKALPPSTSGRITIR
jgi:5'-nucleotidase